MSKLLQRVLILVLCVALVVGDSAIGVSATEVDELADDFTKVLINNDEGDGQLLGESEEAEVFSHEILEEENVIVSEEVLNSSYSSDWTRWNQTDSSNTNMYQYGCYLVASAKLLREAGRTEITDPDMFLNWQTMHGGINSQFNEVGSFLGYTKTYASNNGMSFSYVASGVSFNRTNANDINTIMNYLKKDDTYVAIFGGGHAAYLAKGKSISAGKPIVLESGHPTLYEQELSKYTNHPCTKYSVVKLVGTYKVSPSSTQTITKPTIESASVIDKNSASGIYTVEATIYAPSGLNRVQFPTWTEYNDKDDLAPAWQWDSNISGNITDIGNGRYKATCTIKISDHNNERGKYKTHIYAYYSDDIFSQSYEINNIYVSPLGTHTLKDGRYNIVVGWGGFSYRLDNPGTGNPKTLDNLMTISMDDEYDGEAFNVRAVDGGYYEIYRGDCAIDMYMGAMEPGSNVLMHTRNGSDAQKWIIEEFDGAYTRITSVYNGMVLDVNETGSSLVEANVAIGIDHGGVDQRWRFLPEGTRTIADGTYHIATVNNLEYGLNVTSKNLGANVEISKLTTATNNVFNVRWLGGGYYEITNGDNSIDVLNGSTNTSSNLQIYTRNGSSAQKWVIRDEGNGAYSIFSKCNSLALDMEMSSGVVANGNNIQLFKYHGDANQLWKFVPSEIKITSQSANILSFDNAKGEYKVEGNFHLDSGYIDRVEFPAWTEANGGDDLVWHKATVSYLGNGNYKATATINISSHSNERGKYLTQMYVWGKDQSKQLVNLDAVTFTQKTEPNYSVPTTISSECGKLLSSVSLPTGFTWTEASTTVVTGGNGISDKSRAVYKAKYTPSDTDKYLVVDNISITILVTHKTAFISNGDGTHSLVCSNNDYTGEKISCHGTTQSTCTSRAVCDDCRAEYGTTSEVHHVGETEIRNKVEATCYSKGYTGDTYCKSCNTKIGTGSEIDMLAHKPAKAVKENEKAASCSEQGAYDEVVYCSVAACKAEISRSTKTTDKIAHTLSLSSNGDGTHSQKCSKCTYEGEKTECSSKTKATCISMAVCDECKMAFGNFDLTNHVGDTEVRNAKEAKCYEEGYSGDTYCKSCNTKISDGGLIEKTAHTLSEPVKENEIPSTCSDKGSFDKVVYCAVEECKAEISRENIDTDTLNHVDEDNDGECDLCHNRAFENGIWIKDIDDQIYTGKAIIPSITVYDHNKKLEQNKDYSIRITKNVNVGTALVSIIGKGNYTSVETAVFNIIAQDISDNSFATDEMAIKSTGRDQKPKPVLTWNGKAVAATGYSYFYYKADALGMPKDDPLTEVNEAGNYVIKIRGKGNFTGTRNVKLTVANEQKLVSKLAVVKIQNQPFTGSAIEPTVTVKDGRTELTKDTDYSVEYLNNTNVGTAYAIITGKGNYAGSKRVSFAITGTAIAKSTVEGISSSVAYTGNDISFDDIKLYIKATTKTEQINLRKDIDYEVTYLNNNKAGVATVVFTGINGYTGVLRKSFKIVAFKNADDTSRINVSVPESVEYSKGGAKPPVTVTFANGDGSVRTLTEKTDYTVVYTNNAAVSNAGSAKLPTVKVTLKGSYNGIITKNFSITPKNLETVKAEASDKVYTGRPNTWKSAVKLTDTDGKALVANRDYDSAIVYKYSDGKTVTPTDVVKAGTVITAIITAKEGGNYTGSISTSYRITKAAISTAKVTIGVQTYTGKAIEPSGDDIVVSVGGDPKTEGVDYEIVPGSFTNNIQKGTASVTIRGIGNYGGTKKVNFTIKAKGFSWWWR